MCHHIQIPCTSSSCQLPLSRIDFEYHISMYRSRASLKNYVPSTQLPSVRYASGSSKVGGDKSTTNNPDRFATPADKVVSKTKSNSTSSGPGLGLTIGFMTVIPLAATAIWAKKNPEWSPSGLEGSQAWKQFQKIIGDPVAESPSPLKEVKKESMTKSGTDALSRRDTKKKSPAQQQPKKEDSTPKVQVQKEDLTPVTTTTAAVEQNKITTEKRKTIASPKKTTEKSMLAAKKETAKVEQKKKQEEAIVTPKSNTAPATVAAPVPSKAVVEKTIDQDLEESLKKEQQVIQQITGKLSQIDSDTKKHAVQVKVGRAYYTYIAIFLTDFYPFHEIETPLS